MKYVIAILSIMFIFLQYKIWVGEGNTFVLYKFRKEISSQAEINTGLVKQNRKLESEINDLRYGNKDGIEELARSKLGMIKKGEEYYHFQGSK